MPIGEPHEEDERFIREYVLTESQPGEVVRHAERVAVRHLDGTTHEVWDVRTSRGRRLWRSVVDGYELEEHERGLLVEMARTRDTLERLAAVVAVDGDLVENPIGAGDRIHPALVEARQLRIAYARLSAALRLPAGEEGEQRRPQRRVGVRGVYAVRETS